MHTLRGKLEAHRFWDQRAEVAFDQRNHRWTGPKVMGAVGSRLGAPAYRKIARDRVAFSVRVWVPPFLKEEKDVRFKLFKGLPPT